MKTNPSGGKYESPLSYRMRSSVTAGKNGSPQLILDYPLKSVKLDLAWKPVINRLSTGDFFPFENIVSLMGPVEPDKTEIFLDGLVRKGFLERKGFSPFFEYPFVSIIIPVRNRPEEMRECLISLGELDYPSERFEIIVVDDASDDHTPLVVSTFPARLIVLDEHKQASYCRNLAAREAKGDILAFIDSDCLAGPGWLKELIPVFKDHSLGAIGGMVDAYFNEKALDRYEKVRSSLNTGPWMKRSSKENPFFYVPSCNLLVKRDLFLRHGGFREDFHVGEDVDLCWRLQDQGYHIEYRPMGKVFHKHRNHLKPFFKRRFEYGTSEPVLQKRHSERIKQWLFPKGATAFWAALVLSVISEWIPLFGLGLWIFLMDALNRKRQVQRNNLPVKLPTLFLAVFRSYLAFLYQFSAFVSRYYLIWSFLIVWFLPLATMVVLGIHLLLGLSEYVIRKPRMNLLMFLYYFSLDQLSYQIGVWWGCVKNRHFSPVNPRILWKKKFDYKPRSKTD